MKQRFIGAVAVATAIVTIGSIYAEDQTSQESAAPANAKKWQKGQRQKPEFACGNKEFMEKHKAAMQAHMEQQKSENEAFRATLVGKTPEEVKALKQQHRNKQMAENKELMGKMRDEAVQQIKSSNMPEDAKSTKIKELQDKWAENDARMAKQREENKNMIDKVGADGKVSKEDKEQIKEQRKQQRKENQDYRKEHRKKDKPQENSSSADTAPVANTTK
jgi:hypothetical protein